MPDYDFSSLSPVDFEYLTRDLLQKKLGVFLESFTSGRDGGIDLRHCSDKEKTLIIQCKHYAKSKLSNLKTSLKEELCKIKKLNPNRYIVCTSMSLTPANKDEIKKILHPYIKKTEDIIHKTDLNNLLGLYPDIEKQHIKLWMTSTTVLERIIGSRIHNYSDFELEEIKNDIKTYVKADVYQAALDILKENNVVVISGIPGIGKTTLARMLVYHFLSYKEKENVDFIYLTQNINDAYEKYDGKRRQIFLYDDFLGRNFLEDRLTKNEDKDIVNFIHKIKKSTGKILIFTTREYILKQAKQKYELLQKERNIELAKCTLDVSSYHKNDKAQILYNHLYFSELPNEYIDSLLKDEYYIKIIEHQNYSPRIISRITSPDIFKTINSESFSSTFINYLNNPEEIWEHAFESQIGQLPQDILIILTTCRTPILITDLEMIMEKYQQSNGKAFHNIEFHKSLKELENTFIICNSDQDNIFIDFQNPSIYDFLVYYLDKHSLLIDKLIESACYFDQFFEAFQWEKERYFKKNKIELNIKQKKRFQKIILDNWDRLKSYNNVVWCSSYLRCEISVISKLHSLYLHAEDMFEDFILIKLTDFIEGNNSVDNGDYSLFIDLLERYKDEIIIDDYNQLFDNLICNMTSMEDLNNLHSFGDDNYVDQFSAYITYPSFNEFVKEIIWVEIDDANNSDAETYLEEVICIEKKYKFDLSAVKDYLEGAKDHFEDYEWDREAYESESNSPQATDNDAIIDMFKTLKE